MPFSVLSDEHNNIHRFRYMTLPENGRKSRLVVKAYKNLAVALELRRLLRLMLPRRRLPHSGPWSGWIVRRGYIPRSFILWYKKLDIWVIQWPLATESELNDVLEFTMNRNAAQLDEMFFLHTELRLEGYQWTRTNNFLYKYII